MEQVKYKKPPLKEVACFFKIPPSNDWNKILPGLIYDKVKNRYPGKEIFKIPETEGNECIRFFKKNKSNMIQIGSETISIHQAKNYRNWMNYKKELITILDLIKDTLETKKIEALSLIYFNEISIKADKKIEISEYFNILPSIPKIENIGIEHFDFKIGLIPEKKDDKIFLDFKSLGYSKDGYFKFMMAITYLMISKQKSVLNEIGNNLEIAHNKIKILFDNCITDSTRELFSK